MKYGYVRMAAATPPVRVGDCGRNAREMLSLIQEASEKDTMLIVFPELSITGYTCGDLFLQKLLLNDAKDKLSWLVDQTRDLNIISVVGLPFEVAGKLYNCAAVIFRNEILGIVPKLNLPNYAEFYEKRHFSQPGGGIYSVSIGCRNTVFSSKLLFQCTDQSDFVLGVEICEDLWSPIPPSSYLALNGATIIANLSAGNETTGKDVYRRNLVANQSGRLLCGYVYACAGEGESTTDLVFPGHNMIAENGTILAESPRFANQTIIADIDVAYLNGERRRNTSFVTEEEHYHRVEFDMSRDGDGKCMRIDTIFKPERDIERLPFVPSDDSERSKRCEEILTMQALGLKKRIHHVGVKNIVLGLSGGLDSTLALLVSVRAFDMLDLDRTGIHTVTMPCFGTSERTYGNAIALAKILGTTLTEVNIAETVLKHFTDIGQDPGNRDLTYENAQARERTQVLMSIASQKNGFVVGTGDLSELALGFATYNGDHMSMYGVNASIPKTLVKYLVRYVADSAEELGLNEVLYDVLDTPVSPELQPAEDGRIAQVTEDIVGPYELHDFFLYHMMRRGYEPDKIYALACHAFAGVYEGGVILKWLKVFYRRFFSQQYKRSCLPDGPKVGSVALSPRGDWRMPSDACVNLWMDILDRIG